LAYLEENADKNITPSFNALNLLTYLVFNFRFLLNILCK